MELTRWTPARQGGIQTLYFGKKCWEVRWGEVMLIVGGLQVHPLPHLAPHPHYWCPALHRTRLHEPPDIPRHQAEQTGKPGIFAFLSFITVL